MPVTTLPEGPLHYRVAGPDESGAPSVVFIHGLLVSSELWTKVADALAEQGIRSYAPDLPLGGHPNAMNPDADLHPRGVARMILGFIEALDLTDVTLVGNDTGGALCQFAIDADASRVGRLLLTNCDAFEQFPPRPFNLLVRAGSRPTVLHVLMAPMRLKRLRHSVLGFGGLSRHLDGALTRRWVEPVLHDPGVRRDAAQFMSKIDKRDLVDVSTRLRNFGKPVHLVWGTADPYFKVALAHRLRSAFGQARLVELSESRTFVPLDEPQRLAEEIITAGRAR